MFIQSELTDISIKGNYEVFIHSELTDISIKGKYELFMHSELTIYQEKETMRCSYIVS